MKVGDLVVVPDEPALGVGRLISERDDTVLIHFYDDGELVRIEKGRAELAPSGVWQKS